MRKFKFLALLVTFSMLLGTSTLLLSASADGAGTGTGNQPAEPTTYYLNQFDDMTEVPANNYEAEKDSLNPFLEYGTYNGGGSFSLVTRGEGKALSVMRTAGKPRLQLHITDHVAADKTAGVTVGKSFAFSVLIKPTMISRMNLVLKCAENGTFYQAFVIQTDGKITKGEQIGGDENAEMGTLELNKWSSLCMEVNEDHSFKFYVNGTKTYESTIDANFGTLNRLYIEWMGNTEDDGVLSDIRFDDFKVVSSLTAPTPAPEQDVETPADTGEDTTNTDEIPTLPRPEDTTKPATTTAPKDTTGDATKTDDKKEEKAGCASAIGSGLMVLLGTAAAGACIAVRKKRF